MYFEWFRWYTGTLDDKKFTVVARKAQVPRVIVLGVWQSIIEHAATRQDRGSLDGYDFEENAACLEIEPDEVERVYRALEEKDVIASGRLKNWEKRQPKNEDPTAARRKREQRERDKIRADVDELKALLSQLQAGCHDMSRTVTASHDREDKRREEEKREEEKAAAAEPESVRTDSETPPPEPDVAAAAEVRNMPVSECRALVRKYLGQLMDSPGQTSILQDICRLYPRERIREAFEAAGCSGKTQLNWVKKRLEGRGDDDGRGSAKGAIKAGGKAKGIRPPCPADADWLGTGGT